MFVACLVLIGSFACTQFRDAFRRDKHPLTADEVLRGECLYIGIIHQTEECLGKPNLALELLRDNGIRGVFGNANFCMQTLFIEPALAVEAIRLLQKMPDRVRKEYVAHLENRPGATYLHYMDAKANDK